MSTLQQTESIAPAIAPPTQLESGPSNRPAAPATASSEPGPWPAAATASPPNVAPVAATVPLNTPSRIAAPPAATVPLNTPSRIAAPPEPDDGDDDTEEKPVADPFDSAFDALMVTANGLLDASEAKTKAELRHPEFPPGRFPTDPTHGPWARENLKCNIIYAARESRSRQAAALRALAAKFEEKAIKHACDREVAAVKASRALVELTEQKRCRYAPMRRAPPRQKRAAERQATVSNG